MTNDAIPAQTIPGITAQTIHARDIRITLTTAGTATVQTIGFSHPTYYATTSSTWPTPIRFEATPAPRYARPPFIPPRGVGWRLLCACQCEGVFLPGDDADPTAPPPPRLSGIRACRISGAVYYYEAVWSNL